MRRTEGGFNFDALSAEHCGGRGFAHHFVEQGGFSDTGFTTDKQVAGRSVTSPGHDSGQDFKLMLTTNQHRQSLPSAGTFEPSPNPAV